MVWSSSSASSVSISDGDVKAYATMSPKNGGEEEGDVALVGEEFFVGAAAEELWIGVHRDGGGGAGGVDYLFVVMWVGQRTQGIDEGGGVEKSLKKEGRDFPTVFPPSKNN